MSNDEENRAWFVAYNEYWNRNIKLISHEFLVAKTIRPEEYISRADAMSKAAGIYARNKINEIKAQGGAQ